MQSDQNTQPIEEIRSEKIRKIDELEKLGINAYPTKLEFNQEEIQDVRSKNIDSTVAVAGRISSIRGHGGIRFVDIEDYSGKIQAAFKVDIVSEDSFKALSLIDPGDFIELTGELFLTKSEELTIQVKQFNLLSKAVRPLPAESEGLKDKEIRLRKRYLDLILNEDTRKVFEIRHKLTQGVRDYLNQQGLTEVETPVLQPLYGGANAQPFTTKINALGAEAYLRIASELYLKRLMVTNTKGVFDIAKDFRNEGVDQTHFPEFTMLEAYLSYSNYLEMMDLMEKMVRELAQNVIGQLEVQVNDNTINLNKEWKRVSLLDLVNSKFEKENMNLEELKNIAHEYKIETPVDSSNGQLTFLIFDKLIAPELIDPTWVIDYPIEVSPLSKEHPEKPGYTERFELYVGGKEIMDGWSEINNPLVQRDRFEAEINRNFDVDETAQPIDEDYLEAMEYGMPPMSGVGVGIDRLTMFFSNNWSIQETILFPFKKPL